MNPWAKGKSEARNSGLENVLLGFLMGFWVHWPEIKECLKNCDSWIMKVEKVLTYIGFSLGLSLPSLLVFKVLKNLLNDLSLKLTGLPMNMNEKMESVVQTVISFGGQYGLSGIWNWAKDSTVCLQNNECEEDFLIAIINLKHGYCGMQEEDKDPNFCHKMWNESPLIVIVFLALVLYIVAKYQTDNGDDDDPTNIPSGPTGPNPDPPSDPPPPTGSNPPPNDPDETESNPLPSSSTSDSTSDNPSSPSDPESSPRDSEEEDSSSGSSNPPSGTNSEPSNDPNDSSFPPGQPKFQLLEAYCPTCKTENQLRLDDPSPMFCKHCRDGPPSGPGSQKPPIPSSSNQQTNPTLFNNTSSHSSNDDLTNASSLNNDTSKCIPCDCDDDEDNTTKQPSSPTASSSVDNDPQKKHVNTNIPSNHPNDNEKPSGTNKAKKGDDDGGDDGDPIQKIISKAVKRHITEFIGMVAQGVCAECQDQLDQLVICANSQSNDENNNNEHPPPDKKSRPNLCPYCNHPHDSKK